MSGILDEARRRLTDEEAAARRFDPPPEPPFETYQSDPGLNGDSTRKLRLIQAADLLTKPAPPKWLVKGIIEADTLNVVFGESGAGKSFVALDWACCVAVGADWHGRPVKQGPVVFLAGEGHFGIRRRLLAWKTARKTPLADAPLFVSNCAPMLPSDILQLTAAVDGAAQKLGQPPALIVLDTLARCLDGDENSTRDMGAFVATLDDLRRAYGGPAIAVVHHVGHGDKGRARGAIALRCATDAEYRVERTDGLVSITATKVKDHESPEPMFFELRTVELPWSDEDGQPLTSAVLDATDKRPEPEKQKSNAPLGGNQKKALSALEKLYREHRENLAKGGHDSNGARVRIQDWREKSNLGRDRFYEVKNALEERELITIQGSYVMLNADRANVRNAFETCESNG